MGESLLMLALDMFEEEIKSRRVKAWQPQILTPGSVETTPQPKKRKSRTGPDLNGACLRIGDNS